MAAVGVKEMRAMSVAAMRAEALTKADGIRAAYCQGVQDALAWATTGEEPNTLRIMNEFLAAQHVNDGAWATAD